MNRKLGTTALADMMNVHPQSVRRWRKMGCPSRKDDGLRFNLDEVRQWLKSRGLTGRGRPDPADAPDETTPEQYAALPEPERRRREAEARRLMAAIYGGGQ